VPVADACNPSYSGGKDQEDCDSKLAWADSSNPSATKMSKQERGERTGIDI
jgi:hypothetical protein